MESKTEEESKNTQTVTEILKKIKEYLKESQCDILNEKDIGFRILQFRSTQYVDYREFAKVMMFADTFHLSKE